MQNSNMIISIFMFYYQKKGIPSENPFLFWKEFYIISARGPKFGVWLHPGCAEWHVVNVF